MARTPPPFGISDIRLLLRRLLSGIWMSGQAARDCRAVALFRKALLSMRPNARSAMARPERRVRWIDWSEEETLTTSLPLKTVGSYWRYAPTLYDYIHRPMPYDAPQSLTPEEAHALTAWLLHRNGIVAEDAVMDARTLPAVEMPNRHGFVPDPRPDVASS